MTMRTTTLVLLPILVSLLVAGCGHSGPKKYVVEGTVTYQGNPLPFGTVMFVPENGPPSKPALIDSKGHYRVEAVVGQHRVQVVAMPQRDVSQLDMSVEAGTGSPETQSLIPTKYTRFHTSGITVSVVADGPNQGDITLD